MKLIILGVPACKQSARIGKDREGNARAFKSSKVKRAEENIRAQVISQLPKNHIPWAGPIKVNSIQYIFPLLKKHTTSKKTMKYIEDGNILVKTTKPDLPDNLNKPLFDAMEGIVFLNDSQVYEVNKMSKRYGYTPKTIIDLEETI